MMIDQWYVCLLCNSFILSLSLAHSLVHFFFPAFCLKLKIQNPIFYDMRISIGIIFCRMSFDFKSFPTINLHD